jgi:hypothetical protein
MRPLETHRHRWEANIKMDLRDDMGGIILGEDRDHRLALVNTVMNLFVLYDAGKFLSS